jgi:hypothetical protein
MTRRPPLEAESRDVPLEQLAATAQMLAEALAIAAQCDSLAPQARPRLQLVGVNDTQRADEANLSILTRCYLRARRLREGLFPEGIFADPAWDMLLDLYACKLEGTKVGVSDACAAASVPQTTALRWMDRLEECGFVERHPDHSDSRRINVELTQTAAWRIELWLNATFRSDSAA